MDDHALTKRLLWIDLISAVLAFAYGFGLVYLVFE